MADEMVGVDYWVPGLGGWWFYGGAVGMRWSSPLAEEPKSVEHVNDLLIGYVYRSLAVSTDISVHGIQSGLFEFCSRLHQAANMKVSMYKVDFSFTGFC